jgi:hypothetical protein
VECRVDRAHARIVEDDERLDVLVAHSALVALLDADGDRVGASRRFGVARVLRSGAAMAPSNPGSAWLDQRQYLDLDPRAERALRAAGLAWHDEPAAERLLGTAAAFAPGHIAVVVAHYRYHLYKHRFDSARGYAERCLSAASADLGLPDDLWAVTRAHADFTSADPRVRFWLFALQAYGYILLRCGRRDEGMVVLRKVVALDEADQTKTRVLVDVIGRAEGGDSGGDP